MINSSPAIQRYVPLVCWLVCLLTGLFICLRIVGYGFLPAGDARRHVAKRFAQKPYSQIVVMRPEFAVDNSPGWEWLLGAANRLLGWNEDALMSFSIIVPLLCIFWLPLIWVRRPEAWLAAILAEMLVFTVMIRWTQARPFLVTEGVLIALLFAWGKEDQRGPGWRKILWSTAGFGLSAWMHGSWYLWALLLAAFFLAQRWRDFVYLTASWVAGTTLGALLTGHPVTFLYEAVFIVRIIFEEHAPSRMLVGEFQPIDGAFLTLVLLTLVFLVTGASQRRRGPLFSSPVFWMIALNWVLGFFANRFWADFGVPSALVWMAAEFDQAMPSFAEDGSPKRLLLCGLIAAPLFLDATNDLNRRYSSSLDEIFIDAKDPKLKGWLPEDGGIFYSDNMEFFYNTFYKNPTAPWRYIVGFEPALMLPEDLKVYRAIQRANKSPDAYEPWILKMRTEDRLEIDSPDKPNLPLEWTHVGSHWIGRLPPGKLR